VTSGTLAPFVDRAVGMAYVPADAAAAGGELLVAIRGRRARARIVELPFYSRKKKKAKV
jgi:aminomethyltransferase